MFRSYRSAVPGARSYPINQLAGWVGMLLFAVVLSGCSTTNSSPAAKISKSDSIVILPIINTTETPQAGMRAQVMLTSLLQTAGYNNLLTMDAPADQDALLQIVDQNTVARAVAEAKGKARYGVTGAVQEWRYKVGVDGEPAVGLTLQLIDLDTGAVVWTATGSKTGWSRSSVSGLAQKLISSLISGMAR